MQTIHKEAILEKDGVLIIDNLPLKKGEKVDVQIHVHSKTNYVEKYPLRGKPYKLIDPFGSVTEHHWDVNSL